MSVPEFLEWQEKTLKVLKEKLEAKGALNYDNLLQAFNDEKVRFLNS